MRFVGITGAFVCVFAAMSMGTSVAAFLNLPSAMIVLAVGFGTLVFAHGGPSVALLLRALVSDVEPQEVDKVAIVAQSACKSFTYAGGLGFIIGLVAMLAQLDDPSAIGPAVAVALLTVLYGFGSAAFFWMPTERRMRALSAQVSST